MDEAEAGSVLGRRHLLIVEDSDEDFEAFSRVVRKLGITTPIRRYTTGDDCLVALEDKTASAMLPQLIFMDLNLTGLNGRETLRRIKEQETLSLLPIIVLTTSANPRDVTSCYEAGANSYVVKPLAFGDLLDTLRIVTDFWLKTAVLPFS